MRDLLVTTHTPVLRSGRALRTYGVCRALAAGGGLDVLYVRFEGEQPDAAFSAIPDIAFHELVPSRGARRAVAFALSRLRGVPSGLARGVSAELEPQTERLASVPGRGRVIADGPLAAVTLARLARRRPVAYCAHNFESGFRTELGGGDDGSLRALQRFERKLLEEASESWMVSEADMTAAQELAPGARLRYVPNVVDVAAIEPVEPVPSSQRALFVANFSYRPNEDALEYLVEEIFPLVWEQLPEAQLVLVGGGIERPPEDPRVQSLGFVSELRAAYSDAACVLVPLRLGGGTPLKLIEGLAYGLPVIASQRAVAGLAVRDGQDCLVAADGAAFAAAIVRTISGDVGDLGQRGRARAGEMYSIETLTRLLEPAAPL